MSDTLKPSAVQEFHNARFKANMEIIRSHLTGRSADLLSYEDVRKKVRARETGKQELKEIPLDAIVGSVGRYTDFTRQFLPLVEEDKPRWARVHSLTEGLSGLPPIEVYQIGDVYFVSDGNHRVSVARNQGTPLIEAFVTEVQTDIPLEPDLQPEDLILKERYAHFLEKTRLKETFPDLDMSMTEPGSYRDLEEQIAVHQQWVKENKGEEITYQEAAVRWFQYIYWPIILMIRERGMMCNFPNRTETDLYVWIHAHRAELAEALGWSIDTETAAADLDASQSRRSEHLLKRIGRKINETITPDALKAGPPPGAWRAFSRLKGDEDNCLFPRILVAINGREEGWGALDQALLIACLEEGRIFGLHVIKSEKMLKKKQDESEKIRSTFQERCATEGINGEFKIEIGNVTSTIADRARWIDLVVVSLTHPPGEKAGERLASDFRRLLRICPRPILAVPQPMPAFSHLLLAYDGSPKAEEALFVSAYLAGQWELPITVLTVVNGDVTPDTAERAETYLQEQGIAPIMQQPQDNPEQIIPDMASAQPQTLLIMGSYGQSPLLEAAVGSTIDQILRSYKAPILICR